VLTARYETYLIQANLSL